MSRESLKYTPFSKVIKNEPVGEGRPSRRNSILAVLKGRDDDGRFCCRTDLSGSNGKDRNPTYQARLRSLPVTSGYSYCNIQVASKRTKEIFDGL